MLHRSKPLVRRRVWNGLFALACVGSTWACRAQNPDPSLALSSAEPYVDAFARFDRWSHRARVADAAMPGREAFSEVVFAPLRLDRSVHAAWVSLGGGASGRLGHPEGARLPDELHWVQVEHARVGRLRVALTPRCPGVNEASGAGCVWLARPSPDAASGRAGAIVAFRRRDATHGR